jgi:site-specific recombinase XerD
MLDRFWRYLTVERALAAVTARAYLDMVRPFVQGRLSADCRALNLERLTAADINSFVVTRCPRQSRGAAKLTVTALRSFLRFLHLDGVIEGSLLSAVPSVAGRRLVGLPKGLAPDQVRRLFASCDDTTRRGCRDIAILTMLVRLGMRSGEVAKLRLDDIDWRAGEIIVRGRRTLSNAFHCPQMLAAPWPSISSAAVRSAPRGGQYLSESKLLIATSAPAAWATWWRMPPSGPASGESMRTG